MSDASQVRINELARELEVKAKAIIDLLPGFGVTEKKRTPVRFRRDVAEKVRHQLQGTSEVAAPAPVAARRGTEAESCSASGTCDLPPSKPCLRRRRTATLQRLLRRHMRLRRCARA